MWVGVVGNTMGNNPVGCLGDLAPVHQAQDILSQIGCLLSTWTIVIPVTGSFYVNLRIAGFIAD